MPDLDTEEGCDAHKAMTVCLHAIKGRQKERDGEMIELRKDLATKVSTWLFCWIMGAVFAFLAFNVVMTIATSEKVAVANQKLIGIEETFERIYNDNK